MKKRWIIAVIAILVAVLAVSLLDTVPVYPAFQKEVRSMQEVRQAFRFASMPYLSPENERRNLSHWLTLDGWTAISKPVGYLIGGTESGAGGEIAYVFTGSTKSRTLSTLDEQPAYQGVPFGFWFSGDLDDCAKPYQISLRFPFDGMAYELHAAISGSATDTDAAALAAYAKDTLLTLCEQMIDSASKFTMI